MEYISAKFYLLPLWFVVNIALGDPFPLAATLDLCTWREKKEDTTCVHLGYVLIVWSQVPCYQIISFQYDLQSTLPKERHFQWRPYWIYANEGQNGRHSVCLPQLCFWLVWSTHLPNHMFPLLFAVKVVCGGPFRWRPYWIYANKGVKKQTLHESTMFRLVWSTFLPNCMLLVKFAR